MRRLAVLLALAAVAAVAAPAGAVAATTVVRLDGVGPLKLGMERAAAVKTGWLAERGSGCELDRPVPVTYRLSGPKAPDGISGSVTFQRGKLVNLSFDGGVRTKAGVTVGVTTPATMVKRYKAAGYRAKATYVDTFQGTFVSVTTKRGKPVLGAFAEDGPIATLGLPAVAVCE